MTYQELTRAVAAMNHSPFAERLDSFLEAARAIADERIPDLEPAEDWEFHFRRALLAIDDMELRQWLAQRGI